MPENTHPDFHDALSRLIELPSVSSTQSSLDMGNLPVIHELATWFESLGFRCEIMPVPGEEGKANLIATLGQGPGGLVLAGHTDTVPYNESLWQSNPFELVEKNNRLYGLGTCDMKGFFPLIMEAVRAFRAEALTSPIIVLATADEESSMSGARALVTSGRPKARYAVIGEPTGLKPIHMHKGIMMERIRVIGQSGHSSNPALGKNAMETTHKVISEIMAFRAELAEKYRNPGFTIPTPTINLGCIHGGDNPNRICGHCELDFDVRMLPGMDSQVIRHQLNQRLQPIALADGVQLTLEPIQACVDPFSGLEGSELVKTCETLTGYRAESAVFTTEASFLSQMGMDTVVLGPGDIDQAHQPDEFLALDRIDPTIRLLEALIRQYCL